MIKNKWLKIAIGAVIGGALGFGYYHFIGCSSGSCPISSNPYISTLYGFFAGALISIPTKKKPKNGDKYPFGITKL